MRLTPLEIRQHKFGSAMRGFDRGEVVAFLDTVVADFEDVVRENAQLRREAERLARELDAYRAREKTIQDTLTTAQSVVEQLKRTAIKESESIVVDAELRAEKLLTEARERHAQLSGEIREQRHLRQRLEADLRRTLESYGKLIDAFAAAEHPDGE
ncbi:MAG TPA: DivIVA domain-containing protein [Myxococcota bacterium]|nr:DivIVA domain-containing protein [Myxococcota bacterium]